LLIATQTRAREPDEGESSVIDWTPETQESNFGVKPKLQGTGRDIICLPHFCALGSSFEQKQYLGKMTQLFFELWFPDRNGATREGRAEVLAGKRNSSLAPERRKDCL
jgi:hypothetical protein